MVNQVAESGGVALHRIRRFFGRMRGGGGGTVSGWLVRGPRARGAALDVALS